MSTDKNKLVEENLRRKVKFKANVLVRTSNVLSGSLSETATATATAIPENSDMIG